jgi:hypothetical protein
VPAVGCEEALGLRLSEVKMPADSLGDPVVHVERLVEVLSR